MGAQNDPAGGQQTGLGGAQKNPSPQHPAPIGIQPPVHSFSPGGQLEGGGVPQQGGNKQG